MLPSSGVFRQIDCPHYNAICGRPYCHFRHRSKKKGNRNTDSAEDSADNSNSSNDVPTYKPTPKSQLASTRGHLPISYVPNLVIRSERSNRPPITIPTIEYKPTPKSILSSTKSASEYVPSPVSKDKTAEIANVVDNMDLEDLDTEFGLIDEILSDGSLVEDKSRTEDDKIVEKKVDSVKNKSSSSSSSKKPSKDSKKEKERSTKDKSSSSSKSKRKERDKEKEKPSIPTKDISKDNKDTKIKDKSKSTDSKKVTSEKDKRQSKSSSTSKCKNKTGSDSNSHSSRDKNHKSNKEKHKDKSHKSSKSSHQSKSSTASSSKSSNSKCTEKAPVQIKQNANESNDNHHNEINNDYSNFDPDDLDIDEDDGLTLEEECYRIFNEYKPTPIMELEKNPPSDEKYIPEDVATIGKKRVAYENADKMTVTRLPPLSERIKPNRPSPAQTMLNRIKQAKLAQSNNEQSNIIMELKRQQEELRLKRSSTETPESSVPKIARRTSSTEEPNGRDLIVTSKIKTRIAHQSTSNMIDDILNGRPKPRKIAPVLNVSSIQKAKERVEQLKTTSQTTKTIAQTSSKTSRIAHIPDYSLTDLPDVTHSLKSKLPVNVRTRYLTMFADEAVKLYLSREDAYNRAVTEEDKCYERCSALPTYRNCAMLAINRLRKEIKEREASGLGPLDGDEEDASASKQGELCGERLYGLLERYKMSDEELELHGFPMSSPEPGRAQIKLKPTVAPSLPANQRICARCRKVYLIDKRDFPLYEEECIYHPLKKRTLRGDRTYLCCKSPDDTGCVTSNTHVSEVSEDRVLMGYQTTLPSAAESDPRNHSVYALDCEMCYTTIGLELTRVTIVDPQMKTVYESLVKPLNPILDYNTRFSGITNDQMERTSTNILQVQANILHLCNSNTILIGHSLESDLKALKIIHASVIDTSIMFPHKFGLPHKRALKALASDYLRKIIQNSVTGHDSAEDALTCMELVMWKAKEDLKVKGISSSMSAGSSKQR